jgi:hypothetical protein
LSPWQSSGLPSTVNQRIFVAALILLALVLSCLVVFRIDPRRAIPSLHRTMARRESRSHD